MQLLREHRLGLHRRGQCLLSDESRGGDVDQLVKRRTGTRVQNTQEIKRTLLN